MNNFSIFILLCLISIEYTSVSSHTWQAKPPAYNTRWATTNCRGAECTNACPSLKRDGNRNSRENPAETWRRGESVRVGWVRNNHHGGMVRIAVVPVAVMWDRDWHTKFTIAHTCWSLNGHRCQEGIEDCGTDSKKEVFELSFNVPTVFPDGDYVVGTVWYGGLHYKKKRGAFADFYSCAFIRIQGGEPAGGYHKPFFVAGNGEAVENGKCQTSVDRIGPCDRNTCTDRRSFFAIPAVFNGDGPDPFREEDVQQALQEEENTSQEDSGICVGRICCHSTCGGCGGRACNRMPGGERNCCQSVIQKSGRVCGKYPPPCVKARR